MPTEERFITFDIFEIYKAIAIMSVKEDMPLPSAGHVTALETNDEEGDSIILKIKRSDNEQNEDLKLDRGFFAKSLVFFCQGSGIPLPRGGTKNLLIAEDKVVMKIVMG